MVVKQRVTAMRQERELRGWSRQYIAEQVGVDLATVGRWERGERVPHPHYRQMLCELFQMNALELGLQKPVEPALRADEMPTEPVAGRAQTSLSSRDLVLADQLSKSRMLAALTACAATLALFTYFVINQRKQRTYSPLQART